MATLRRLSMHESSIYSIRTVIRASPRFRAANHHYWATRAGKSYGRSSIYDKDTYYTRWIIQRNSRYARPCGSWSRWDQEKAKKDSSNGQNIKESSDINLDSKHSPQQSRHPFESDHFFNLLRQDPSTAYKYMHEEIQKDPYKWFVRDQDNGGAWNVVEWWNRRKRIFDRRRSWLGNATSEEVGRAEDKAETPASNTPKEEEYRIDPITMKKVPVIKASNNESEQDSLYPQYLSPSIHNEHIIPVTKYEDAVIPPVKSSHIPESKKAGIHPKLAGFANQSWLVNEGFAAGDTDNIKIESLAAKSPTSPKHEKVKIESSLDRLTRPKVKARESLSYPLTETTTDDVDLLQASSIRAASGRIKPKTGPTAEEKKEKSENLEKNWNNLETTWTKNLTRTHDELLENRKGSFVTNASKADDDKSQSRAIFKEVKNLHDILRQKIEETAALLEKARGEALRDVLSQETNLMKQSFDRFEERSRKHSTALENGSKAEQPVINDKLQQEHLEQQARRLEKAESDAKLVRQIREIYEEKYGKITTDHKQGVFDGYVLEQDKTKSSGESKAEIRPFLSASAAAANSIPSVSDHGSQPALETNGITYRDLIYKGLDGFDLSHQDRKRVKFGLRSMPHLDIVINGLAKEVRLDLEEPHSMSALPEAVTDAQDKQESESKGPKVRMNPEPTPKGHKRDKKSKSTASNSKSSSSFEKVSANKARPKVTDQPDPEHIQHKQSEEKKYIYKILALDNATNEVVVATTNSKFRHKTSLPRSTAAILVHLDQPARYFNHIEKLDSENYRIVSGSRTMLVFRKEVEADRTTTDKVVKERNSSVSPRPMTPLRIEPVFSGHMKPKDRLLRSYQLAHRRARANASKLHQKESASVKDSSTEAEFQQATEAKKSRNWKGKFVTAALVVTVCYTIGLVRNMKEQKERAQAAAQRYQEAAFREVEALKNKRNWF